MSEANGDPVRFTTVVLLRTAGLSPAEVDATIAKGLGNLKGAVQGDVLLAVPTAWVGMANPTHHVLTLAGLSREDCNFLRTQTRDGILQWWGELKDTPDATIRAATCNALHITT